MPLYFANFTDLYPFHDSNFSCVSIICTQFDKFLFVKSISWIFVKYNIIKKQPTYTVVISLRRYYIPSLSVWQQAACHPFIPYNYCYYNSLCPLSSLLLFSCLASLCISTHLSLCLSFYPSLPVFLPISLSLSFYPSLSVFLPISPSVSPLFISCYLVITN